MRSCITVNPKEAVSKFVVRRATRPATPASFRSILAILTISFIYELERECSNGTEQARDRHSAPEAHDRA